MRKLVYKTRARWAYFWYRLDERFNHQKPWICKYASKELEWLYTSEFCTVNEPGQKRRP